MDESVGDAVAAESAADALVVDGGVRHPWIGSGAAEGAGAVAGGRKQRPLWREVPLFVVAAIVLAAIVKTFFVQAFYIPSQSMQNTLQPGDRVLVDKLSPWFGATPQRGQVIVFKDPGGWLAGEDLPAPSTDPVLRDVQSVLSTLGLMPSASDQDLIKRVIAVGGDTVVCKAGAPVSVDGVALTEPYIYPGATPCDNYPAGTVTVPKGDLWVMGDHRDDSADSRYQRLRDNGGGFVPVKDVIGRAFVVAWPISHWKTLSVPSTFHQGGLSASALQAAPSAALDGGALVLPLTLWYRRRRRNHGPSPRPPFISRVSDQNPQRIDRTGQRLERYASGTRRPTKHDAVVSAVPRGCRRSDVP